MRISHGWNSGRRSAAPQHGTLFTAQM